MPYKNDAEFLSWTLEKIPLIFDKYIFIDTGSTDGSTELITARFQDAIIIKDELPYIDFAQWRNDIMARAEQEACDWVFMLDSDETIFIHSYQLLRDYARSNVATLYRVSRIDFIGEKRDQITFAHYPDWQARLIKCNEGYQYAPKIHSQPCLNGETARGAYIPHITIYHYGWTRDPRYKALHYYNAERSLQGLESVKELPPEVQLITHKDILPFIGEQP
jgi:glycosyltransferase involved in cell wall biosynthesis